MRIVQVNRMDSIAFEQSVVLTGHAVHAKVVIVINSKLKEHCMHREQRDEKVIGASRHKNCQALHASCPDHKDCQCASIAGRA